LIGRDRSVSPAEVMDSARSTLAAVGLSVEKNGKLALEEWLLTDKIRNNLVADSYELLLVLSLAEAPPRAGEIVDAEGAKRALPILQYARKLGLRTRFQHAQLAEVLKALKDRDEEKERRLAEEIHPDNASDFFLE